MPQYPSSYDEDLPECKKPLHRRLNHSHLVMYTSPGQSHNADANPSEFHRTNSLLPHPNLQKELLEYFFINFDAAPISPRDNPPTTQSDIKLELLDHMRLNSLCEAPFGHVQTCLMKLDKAFHEFAFECLLEQIYQLVSTGYDRKTDRLIRAALRVALRLNNDISTARLYLWLGILAYRRGEIALAHAHAISAYPCVGDNACYSYEKRQLGSLLDLTRPDLSQESREAREKAWIQLAHPDSKAPYTPKSVDLLCGPEESTQAKGSNGLLPTTVQPTVARPRKILKPRKPVPKPRSSTYTLGTVFSKTITSELGYESEDFDGKIADITVNFTGLRAGFARKPAGATESSKDSADPTSGESSGSTGDGNLFIFRGLASEK